MTREIVTFQIGKTGVSLGHEFWKQISSEFYINPIGNLIKKKDAGAGVKAFFNEYRSSVYRPRTILIDLEPRTINILQKSTHKQFYDKKSICIGKKNIGNNWVTGLNQAFDNSTEISDIIRKNIERCDTLGGFNFFHSIGGGTGSGTTSQLLELLDQEYPKQFKNLYSIAPNQNETSDIVVQPYNSILTIRWLILYSDCVTFFENFCFEKIINQEYNDEKIYLKHINTLISKVITNSLSHIACQDSFNSKIENFMAAMIPIPNLHFLFTGISDFLIPGKMGPVKYKKKKIYDVLKNFSLDLSLENGQVLSMSHFTNEDVKKIHKSFNFECVYKNENIKFIDWMPVPFQNFHVKALKNKKNQIEDFCFLNSSCIKTFFKKTLFKYDLLKKRNAFLTNFLIEFDTKDGMELFEEAEESVKNLLDEYENFEKNPY